MTRLSRRKAIERIRVAVARVHRFLRRCGAPVPRTINVRVDCPITVRQRIKGDRRAFFHVGHISSWTICTVEEAGKLSNNHLYAIVLHEFGHPIAQKLYGRSRQEDADKAIYKFTGIPILYKTGLVLQWITSHDVSCLKQRTTT